MKKKVTINTPNGEGVLEEIYISELNYLMIKVFFPDEKKYISFNLGKHDTNNNIFSNLIMYKELEIGHIICESEKVPSLLFNLSTNMLSLNEKLNLKTKDFVEQGYTCYDLCIFSNEKIENGDWIYETDLKTINKAGHNYVQNNIDKKIVAIYNKPLLLSSVNISPSSDFTLEQISKNMPVVPQISNDFINNYIKYCNNSDGDANGNMTTKVFVKYEKEILKLESDNTISCRLKSISK